MSVSRPALLLAATALFLAITPPAKTDDSAKISRPGQYEGYSPVLYDGWALSSVYVPARDGTRLAIDIARPTRSGVVAEDKLPVVWMHTPYNRRPIDGESRLVTAADSPLELVKYGYVVAVADFRGLYASFGKNLLYTSGPWIGPAQTDAYDITEWLAKQPWSSGKIGMWGCSAQAGSQLQAATTLPPSLRAIFPMSTAFEYYDITNYGGIQNAWPSNPGNSASRDVSASPVDGPDGPRLLQEAIAKHVDDPASNRDMPFRDSSSPTLGENWWRHSSPSTYIDEIGQADIGVYTGGNWDDADLKDGPALVFANLPRGKAKLIYTPHTHCDFRSTAQQDGLAIQVEQLRFFDYWLKGIDNGVMEEPAVTYYTYNAPAGNEWRQSETWPLPNEQRTTFYLAGGQLLDGIPESSARDETAMGEPSEANSIMLKQAEGGLAYESAPLAGPVEVTGYPVVELWISAESEDADVVAQIADLAPDGSTRSYHMIGRLRASHRKLADAPYENFGLPYPSHLSADAQPLPKDGPAELRFALLPMSYIFAQGHRIRVTVTFSDPASSKGAATLWTGPATPSQIVLPIIPTGRN